MISEKSKRRHDKDEIAMRGLAAEEFVVVTKLL